jgi:NADH-quinone oxidoreductase subunit D
VLRRAEPQFGFLHRGTEKLTEGRTFLQAVPYFDRFDYVANLVQEHAFCLSLEALSPRAGCLTAAALLGRTLFDELSRLLNHLLTLSATALDLGAMGPIFWAFEEREGAMSLLELASGARMHTALYRPGGLDLGGLTGVFFRDLAALLTRCARALGGAFLGLLANRALRSRLASVGALSPARAMSYGVSGIVARSTGYLQDRRFQRDHGYGAYGALAFRTFVGRRGDNLDRFLLRIKEVGESARLLSQLAQLLCAAPAVAVAAGVASRAGARLQPPSLLSPHQGRFSGMGALICHFREASEGSPSGRGLAYRAAESPKGEVGVFLVGAAAARPTRLKVRTPVSHNMHLIPALSAGVLFADFVATFCSLDIVLGEIDR